MDAGPGGGKLARNVMHFARALRAAGLPVGPGRLVDALKAVETVGIGRRADLYWTLFAVFVSRRDQRELFDQCFHVFWRDPKILERMMGLLLPQLEAEAPPGPEQEVSRRVGEALGPERAPGEGEAEEDEPPVELDAVLTWSAKELLQGKDFEQMSADELAAAKREIQKLRLPIMEVPTRRFVPEAHGRRIDMRRTLRQSLRDGGDATAADAQDAAAPPSAARHPLRHLGLDEPLLAHAAALHARGDERSGPGVELPLRHPAHQRHAPSPPPRHRHRPRQGGRGRAGLVRRHAHRPLPRGVQPRLVAPRARPGGGRPAHQRRARPRRRRRPGRGDGASAQELPAPRLAQSPVALRRLQPHLVGGPGDDPTCRRFPLGAQSRRASGT